MSSPNPFRQTLFASPVISLRNITAAPYAVLAWMAGWSLWTAFNM